MQYQLSICINVKIDGLYCHDMTDTEYCHQTRGPSLSGPGAGAGDQQWLNSCVFFSSGRAFV